MLLFRKKQEKQEETSIPELPSEKSIPELSFKNSLPAFPKSQIADKLTEDAIKQKISSSIPTIPQIQKLSEKKQEQHAQEIREKYSQELQSRDSSFFI
jgi:hypothetical protein